MTHLGIVDFWSLAGIAILVVWSLAVCLGPIALRRRRYRRLRVVDGALAGVPLPPARRLRRRRRAAAVRAASRRHAAHGEPTPVPQWEAPGERSAAWPPA